MRHAVLVVAAAALLLVIGLVSPAAAQTVERHLHITVVDDDGFPVQGLDDGDFLIWEDGSPREIVRAVRATEPMQIDILVDTSAAARQILSDVRRALEGFVADVHGGNDVAVITFGGTRSIVVEPTSDLERLHSGIAKLFSRPDTATYLVEAVDDSAGGFRRRGATRPVAIVVTTTGVDFSDHDPEHAVTRLRQMGAPMHAVVMRTSQVQMVFTDRFGLSEFPSWANRARDLLLDIGPKQTGGHRLDISTTNGLPEVLSRLALELTNQYFVAYASPETLVPPQTVEIRVNVDQNVSVRVVPARTGGPPR